MIYLTTFTKWMQPWSAIGLTYDINSHMFSLSYVAWFSWLSSATFTIKHFWLREFFSISSLLRKKFLFYSHNGREDWVFRTVQYQVFGKRPAGCEILADVPVKLFALQSGHVEQTGTETLCEAAMRSEYMAMRGMHNYHLLCKERRVSLPLVQWLTPTL